MRNIIVLNIFKNYKMEVKVLIFPTTTSNTSPYSKMEMYDIYVLLVPLTYRNSFSNKYLHIYFEIGYFCNQLNL